MPNVQTPSPYPSPPRGEGWGEGIKVSVIKTLVIICYWCLEFGYYHIGLWFSFHLNHFELDKGFPL